MSLRKISFILLIISAYSCSPNDDGSSFAPSPIVDRVEQQIIDDALLQEYFNTHYYNAGDFVDVADPKIADITIAELPDNGVLPNPEVNKLLRDELVNTANPNGKLKDSTVVFENTSYKMYYLVLNQGSGIKTPNFTDRIRVNFEGSLLNGNVFDSAVTPVDLSLIGATAGSGPIVGWKKIFPIFSVAESFTDNNDGIINYTNHGTGVMFLPSGLAYLDAPPQIDIDSPPPVIIPSLAPLVFKFELLQTFDNDHDNDGIPSHLEKIVTEGVFADEFLVLLDDSLVDDDTDGDGTPNYVDTDDDGDGTLTINEDMNNDGDPTNDIGPNGIALYLDPDN